MQLQNSAAVHTKLDFVISKLARRLQLRCKKFYTNFGFSTFFFVFALEGRTEQTDRRTNGRAGETCNAFCRIETAAH